MATKGSSRLVARFALSSLVAFLALGAILSVVMTRQLRGRQEDAAQFHAQFVVDSILSDTFHAADLKAPTSVSSRHYQDLVQFVRARILVKPVVRIKIWGSDGTVLFSDEPRLVGQRFEVDDDLKEAFAGETISGVTDLEEKENVFERALAPKLFSTYTPLYPADSPSGKPVAVAEIYQDYAGIQSQINRLFGELAVALVLGLGGLYAALFPILRRASRTLARQNAQLEDQAVRLEELLATEQRRVAELSELNRLKDEFVAVASHELRTPLTSIIGYAKTLRRSEFAEDVSARNEFLEAIERQGDRLHRLVQNLLAASHEQDEGRRVTIEPIDVAQMVQDVAAGVGEARGRIRLDVPRDLPLMVSDRQRVELILSNLMDNALKFSSDGTPCEVGARADGSFHRFWVRDEGVGIPSDQLDRIFDRFYQVDSSVTRRYGGVGLGLSLVKGLVESLRGTIEVQSEPNRGSVFTVLLPVLHRDAEPASSVGNGGSTREQPAEPGDAQLSGLAKSTLPSVTST